MRDRYLGLLLAMLAWMIAPMSSARAADASDPLARAAAASDVQATVLASERSVERKHVPSHGACELARACLPTSVAAMQIVDDVAHTTAAPHAKLHVTAQPRGPPC
ncbi:MAG TPA: hypothetical protein VG755_08620 [Nannocystaceae bacterium]|nr:hypothetical protein [Nannocystaceae bacterium]